MKNVSALPLMLVVLLGFLVSCSRKAEEDLTPVNTYPRIRQIVYQEHEGISSTVLNGYLTNPLALDTAPNAYSATFTYDNRGRLITETNQKLTYSTTRVLRSAQNASLGFDTLYLNPQGFVQKSVITYARNNFLTSVKQYDADGYLTSEQAQLLDPCYGSRHQAAISHTIRNGNRVATSVQEQMTGTVSIQTQYEFDESQPNTGLGFDTFKVFSNCAGMFSAYGNPSTDLYGKLNRNLIRKATRTINGGAVTQYTYYYTFDEKKRVKTQIVTAQQPNSSVYAINRRVYTYLD
ncbi:hypothetical protein HNV11_05560 [Spirosoma taeanense]|uniref:YD repeat-containing protein n=1 Tax=Spirosoma taeanense TaxID=2735870 RepID=A0A6M5Y2L9_9BACT|nr:hypothetical protein [Spirosoma taeanense]QJW88887.1 hypothetical protein HNV11_05560 [Spirosoma taeanense]